MFDFFILIPSAFTIFLPIVLVIALQYHLSKVNQKFGLILPTLTGIFASILLYISFVSGLAHNALTSFLFILIFYLPTFTLFFIFYLNQKKPIDLI